MTKRVYAIRQSVDDESYRPDVVTYYDPTGEFKIGEGFKRFQKNCCVAAGKDGCRPDDWFVPNLYASKPGKTQIDEWDYYMCSTFGAFAQRAMDVLTPYLGNRFLPLPARLEGRPYFCLHCQSRIDCLDKASSEIEYYDDSQEEVMTIEKYVFHKTILPDRIIFAIPEATFCLFCSDQIPEIAASAGLRGFDFQLADE